MKTSRSMLFLLAALVTAFTICCNVQGESALAQQPTRITQSSLDEIAAAWNPASDNIAYLRSEFGAGAPFRILQTNASPGSPELPVFSGPALDFGPTFGAAFSPAWIGTTGFLACYESINIPEFLFINTLLGPTTRTIPDGPENTFFPAIFADSGSVGGYIKFSRDGSLFFVREINAFGGANLRSASIFDVLFSPLVPLPLTTFGVVQLSSAPSSQNFFTQGVALSPDGTFFVAALPISGSNSPHDLWLFRTDAGITPVNLTNNAASGVWNVTPDISPDGTAIVFSRWSGIAGESFDLFGIDTDGSLTQLTVTPNFQEYGPSWAPDGLRIAYEAVHDVGFESSFPPLRSGEQANSNIYVLQVREIRTVTRNIVPNLPIIRTNRRKVTINAEEFAGASLQSQRRARSYVVGKVRLSQKRRPQMRNFSFQYEYSVQRTRNAAGRRVKNDVRRKVIKRNTTTFSKLPPGTYKASYRATINKRVNGTVSRVGVSKRSPTYNFQVR